MIDDLAHDLGPRRATRQERVHRGHDEPALLALRIELDLEQAEQLLGQLNQPKHFPKLIDSAFWCATGLGYDCEYPRRICESLLTMPQL